MGISLVDTAVPMNENGYPVARAKHIWFDDNVSLQTKLDNQELGSGGSAYVQLSQDEYDNLTDDERLDGREFRIYDTGHIYRLGVEFGKDACFTSLSQLGLTADATIEDVVNALKNGESFLAPVNTFTNYETIFPNKVPNDKWNKIHIIKGNSLPSSHIRCFSQSGTSEYLANINNTNVVGWNDVSGTYIDISDGIIEKLGNEILKYPVGKYRINSTTTGNKFIDLPSDSGIKCGLIEVNGTAVGKSPFTDTWVYRMYKFECLTGSLVYTRRLNSGATVGQIESDTGWCVKQNIYTSLKELGLTAPTTVGEVFMAMPEKSMLMLNVEALVDDGTNALTVTDVPKEFGVLTIEKHIYGRFRIEYSNSLGGAVFNARKWIGALKGSDGTGLVWKEVNTGNHKYTTMAELALEGSTATIQDVMDKVAVGDSVMIRTDAFNNNNWQTQCNGIQWGYLKIEKTMNGLSNIELQEVITPNRRYFGTQSGGKFVGWVETTGTKGLVSNAQNFKIDLTKNNASWYGMFTFNFVYGTTPCEITVTITDKVYYTITKGQDVVSAITYTRDGANYIIGIDLTAKVYGTQVVEMPVEFGTINSLTAEQFTGDITATISTISEEPIILRYNMPETFSYPKYGITQNNTITEVVRAIGNYFASKYSNNQNITLQVILSTNYNSSTFNKSLPCNGRSSITTITYMPYKFASRVKIETMNTHTGETYLGSLNDSETDDIVWKQIATKSTYNSIAELNKAKGTNIELVNGEDNTKKIVDALSVGEQFISLYHNNANQNRFGIDVGYGNLIHELRITKCLDADLTANYATVTAFMNTGCVMSRIYYKTYSTDWSSTKDYVESLLANS